jgi:hypothetical protein
MQRSGGSMSRLHREVTAEFGVFDRSELLSRKTAHPLSSIPVRSQLDAFLKELKCLENSSGLFVHQCGDYVPPIIRIVKHFTRRSLGMKDNAQPKTVCLRSHLVLAGVPRANKDCAMPEP